MPDTYSAGKEMPAAAVSIQGRHIEYRHTRSGSSAYLVLNYSAAIKEDFDNTAKGGYSRCQCMMLQSCKIRSFLPLRMMEADGQMQFYYNITSAITLQKFLSAKVIGIAELLSLLIQTSGAVKNCGGYLLDSRCIILEPDFIYIDPFDLQLKFVHFPVNNEVDITENFRKLTIWIIDNACTTKGTEENGDVIVKLRNILNSELFSISRFITEIEKPEGKRAENLQTEKLQNCDNIEFGGTGKRMHTKNAAVKAAKSIPVKDEYPKPACNTAGNGSWFKRKKHINASGAAAIGKANNFLQEGAYSEDIRTGQIYNEEDKTVLLGRNNTEEATESLHEAATRTTAFLRNLSGDITMEIQTGNSGCVIGRKKDLADCVINNRAVGKIHAEIVERDGEYFIKDLNSRNGTCVNSVRIEPGTEIKISHRDVLTFANEDYILIISR